MKPWPKIWSVQSDHTNSAFFNLASAEHFIAERTEPHKFQIIEYIPTPERVDTEAGLLETAKEAQRVICDELCERQPDHREECEALRRAITNAEGVEDDKTRP